MCGFTGFVQKNDFELTSIKAMSDKISHRGRDDESYCHFNITRKIFCKKNLLNQSPKNHILGSIGFKRLSIQDLTIQGRQPMYNNKKDISIIFNGEIYNKNKLEQKLKNFNLKFRGTSDTERLLEYYQYFGIDSTLEEIDGIFSFVIIDFKKRKIFLARDHLGVKPLYYHYSLKNNVFVFGSEIKTLFENSKTPKIINHEIVDEYLLYGSSADNKTIFKDIYEVKSGHYIQINMDFLFKKKIKEKKYYDLPLWTNKSKKNFNLNKKIKETVSDQLVSDVKICSQLSGGIDSSLLSAIISKKKKNLKTFSITFNQKNINEEKYINYVKKKFNIKNYQKKFKNKFFLENLEKATWYHDQPLSHPNCIGLFLLSKQISKYSKVSLSGEGADELFGGYEKSTFATPIYLFLRLMSWIIGRLIKIPKLKKFGNFINKEINFIFSGIQDRLSLIQSINNKFKKNKILHKRLKIFNDNKSKNFLEKTLDYDLKVNLKTLLDRQDKMLMSNTVENRVPYISKKFIRDVRLNISSKSLIKINIFNLIKFGENKYPLKEVAKLYFNENFVYRKKVGFAFPLEEIIDDKNINKIFFGRYIFLIEKFTNYTRDMSNYIWANGDLHFKFQLLCLGAWLEVFFN